MRILLTSWPFVGHISPIMSVGLALQHRGHEVALYTGSSIRDAIEAEGIQFFPFEQVDEAKIEHLVALMDTAGPNRRPKIRAIADTFRQWFAETIPAQIADLSSIVRDWEPHVIVTETGMWGPIVVLWEQTGIPVVILSTLLSCLIPGPGAPISALGLPPPSSLPQGVLASAATAVAALAGRPLRRRIDEIRAGFGLQPLGCSVNEFTARLPLYLVGNVSEFDFNRTDLPPSVNYVGPLYWRRMIQADCMSWLDSVATDRPWIHVTESTLRFGEPFVLKAAVRGLADGAYELIMSTGAHRDVRDFDADQSSPHVHIAPWIDHAQLLPRCAAMVSTGGAGTVLSAVLSGIPQVIIPTAWDKPDNASRVVDAGVGIRLSPRECTPARLRSAVDEVVSNPRYAENARRIKGNLMDAVGPDGAAEMIERVVSGCEHR